MRRPPSSPGRRGRIALSLALLAVLAAAVLLAASAVAQDESPPVPIPTFQEYDPPSTLVVPAHPVPRAKYPFIDVHSHQPRMPEQDLGELVAAMDRLNMAVMVNLSGRGFRRVELPDGTTRFGYEDGDYLARAVARAREEAPGRFMRLHQRRLLGRRRRGVGGGGGAPSSRPTSPPAPPGSRSTRAWGWTSVDVEGKRIPVDDPRLDPVWAKCGELGIPVLIHTADPAPFWQPRDATNERLYELIEIPRRWRDPAENPPWEQLIAEQHTLFRRHPGTRFINAHLGWLGNDLARLGRLLDELPNVYTEIGAVLAELGRQPRFAREWLDPLPGPGAVRQGRLGAGRVPVLTSGSSRPTTTTSTTTAAATRSGRSTASTCPTRCCARSTTATPCG